MTETTTSTPSSTPGSSWQSRADELRAAARELEQHVAAAAGAPWVAAPVRSPDATATSGVYSHAYNAGTVESEVVAAGRVRPGYGGIRDAANAEYIALVDPAIGAELVHLLRLEATAIRQRRKGDGGGGNSPDGHTFHLLTIARRILAKQPGYPRQEQQ